jgi:hypothetical protein
MGKRRGRAGLFVIGYVEVGTTGKETKKDGCCYWWLSGDLGNYGCMTIPQLFGSLRYPFFGLVWMG